MKKEEEEEAKQHGVMCVVYMCDDNWVASHVFVFVFVFFCFCFFLILSIFVIYIYINEDVWLLVDFKI